MALIFFVGLGITFIVTVVTLNLLMRNLKSTKLPPGRTGWPIIGETLAHVSCPERFVRDRMSKHSPEVFKTSLAGERMAVFCGPSANKFIFSNQSKLVKFWLPRSIADALSQPEANTDSPSWKLAGEVSYKFLRLESMIRYVSAMDSMAREHLDTYWSPYNEVKVHPLAKQFTFALACRLFADSSNLPSSDKSRELTEAFYLLTEGIFSAPVNIPGTPFYKAMKGGKLVKEKIIDIIRQRRREMSENGDHKFACQDMLGHFLLASHGEDDCVSEDDIASKIIGFMFGSFHTTSSAITFVISHLAEHPHIYEKVLQEQLEIARSKEPGELMNWKDIQKMKYSWNVICESMRLIPPTIGGFKEVLTDFSYEGFTIPKGWKIHWTVHSTNKDPKYFSDPEKFDPSRFEGNGPAPFTFVPFGGGPRMCAGKEYARIEILAFLHNVVTRFRLKKMDPAEKVISTPDPVPAAGLRVYLRPHEI